MGDIANLDDVDIRICSILSDDGRASNTSIAKKLGISESMVRKRIKRMREEGLLRIVGYGDPWTLGFPLATMIFFHIEPKHVLAAAEALTAMKETHFVAVTSGSADIVVRCAFKSEKSLFDFLFGPVSQIKGLIKTETSLLLNVMKRGGNPFTS